MAAVLDDNQVLVSEAVPYYLLVLALNAVFTSLWKMESDLGISGNRIFILKEILELKKIIKSSNWKC